jgi:catechol 2,3-dioxygenase-like lactoylglutathione lyase family enzyme
MIRAIETLIREFEQGKLNRRQLVASLAALATSVPAPAAAEGLRAVSVNHVTVRVPDLHRTSQFYQEFFAMPLRQSSAKIHILAVGDSFFGIEQGDRGSGATVDHFDFGIADFNADEARAKLKKRNLKYDSDSKESFKFHDPDGFVVQLNAKDYEGHVS